MADFEKKVKITVISDRCDAKAPSDHEKTEFKTSGRLISAGGRVVLSYNDSELLDGSNSGVELSFDASDPEVVTMLRRGDISAMMVFDKSNCHRSVYRTPYMNFDLEIRTSAVDNQLLLFGRLNLNYVIDIRGISAERNDLTVIISER